MAAAADRKVRAIMAAVQRTSNQFWFASPTVVLGSSLLVQH
jgi:hypothetical protein